MSLIEDYEQQYSILTAEITAQIGKLRLVSGVERRNLDAKIDTNIAEAQELLEQIGLEIREADVTNRQLLTNKHNCYLAELKRLQHEYKNANSVNSTNYDTQDEYDDNSVAIKDDQKRRLLETSERIERTGNKLTDGYRIVLETEQIGTQVLQDLHHQRETLQNSRSKLRETNAELGRSSRLLNNMWMRSFREKFILYGVGVIFVIAVSLSIYFSLAN